MLSKTNNQTTIPDVNFDDLPTEMKVNIFNYLDLPDLQRARKVSSEWLGLYHALNNKRLADKALAFLNNVDSYLALTNELLDRISYIARSAPAYREKFYFALRVIRNRLLLILATGQPADKAKLQVSPADLHQCMIKTFGLGGYLEDNLLALFLQPGFDPIAFAVYFAPFVVLRSMLQNGRGRFELKLCNKIYTQNFFEKLVFTDNELYFVVKHQPEQRFTLSQLIDHLFHHLINDNQLSQLKTNINHIAASIIQANEEYSCTQRPMKQARHR